jgi:multiple sugar transport system ATP-binding protein
LATVSLDQVTKVYRGRREHVRAVDGLSVEIADEELVVLVGPSGCGKTTTLRMIAGLEPPTEGTIRIDGRVVNDVQPKDRDIAMVFQNYALYPHMTVYDNMAFGLKMRKTPKAAIREKVGETAAMLGMTHLLDRKPKALSGGEKQRVAVGRAIVRRPKVFLFDEPLSNLDARLRVHMRTEIKSLQRELRTTAVYVTHDHEEAMTLGDRLVVMKDGRVQQCGTPLDVYNHPANRFVAGFLGSPSMNFVEGELELDGSRAVFRGPGIALVLPEHFVARAPAGRAAAVLGIRPEHLRIDAPSSERSSEGTGESAPADAADGVVRVRAFAVEPLGESVIVHFDTPVGLRLVARSTHDVAVCPGDARAVTLRADRVHLFVPGDCGASLSV